MLRNGPVRSEVIKARTSVNTKMTTRNCLISIPLRSAPSDLPPFAVKFQRYESGFLAPVFEPILRLIRYKVEHFCSRISGKERHRNDVKEMAEFYAAGRLTSNPSGRLNAVMRGEQFLQLRDFLRRYTVTLNKDTVSPQRLLICRHVQNIERQPTINNY